MPTFLSNFICWNTIYIDSMAHAWHHCVTVSSTLQTLSYTLIIMPWLREQLFFFPCDVLPSLPKMWGPCNLWKPGLWAGDGSTTVMCQWAVSGRSGVLAGCQMNIPLGTERGACIGAQLVRKGAAVTVTDHGSEMARSLTLQTEMWQWGILSHANLICKEVAWKLWLTRGKNGILGLEETFSYQSKRFCRWHKPVRNICKAPCDSN